MISNAVSGSISQMDKFGSIVIDLLAHDIGFSDSLSLSRKNAVSFLCELSTCMATALSDRKKKVIYQSLYDELRCS